MDKMVAFSNSFNYIFIFLLSVLVFWNCAGDTEASQITKNTAAKFTETIPPSDFLRIYKESPGALMFDVRTRKEYHAGKVVPEAINVDYHGENFITDILEYDRSDPVFVYCFSGGRSSKAAFRMRQLGFDRIYEMKGGYQRWQKENKK